MRFVDYILSKTEYNNIFQYFIIRPLLGMLVSMFKSMLEAIESMLNASFAMFNFIYSQEVINWIRPWLPWLSIPLIISVLILGFNLIINNNEIIEKGVHKKFVQNFCLLVLIVLMLPVVFLGTRGSGANVWQNADDNSGKNGTNGVISIFTSKDGKSSPLLNAIENPDGSGDDEDFGSIAEQTIADNVVDLQYVYNTYGKKSESSLKKNTWSKDSGVNENKNAYSTNSKGVWDDVGGNLGDLITADESEKTLNGKIKDINKLDVSGNMFLTKEDDSNDVSHDNLDPFGAGIKKPGQGDWNDYDDNSECDASVYLFYSRHVKHQWGDGDNDYTYTSLPMSKGLFDWEPLSEYPYRYYVDWGVLIIQLLFSTIVLIGMSFKVVSIVYELAFAQFFAIFTAASDLNGGQKTREVIRVIASLILTVAFTGVLFKFYQLGTSYVNNTFSDQVWIKVFFDIFLGIACIKGTTILQHVLGIDGGGTGRSIGSLLGAGFAAVTGARAIKGAGHWAKDKVVNGAKRSAAGIGGIAGAVAARRQHNTIGGNGGVASRPVNIGGNNRGMGNTFNRAAGTSTVNRQTGTNTANSSRTINGANTSSNTPVNNSANKNTVDPTNKSVNGTDNRTFNEVNGAKITAKTPDDIGAASKATENAPIAAVAATSNSGKQQTAKENVVAGASVENNKNDKNINNEKLNTNLDPAKTQNNVSVIGGANASATTENSKVMNEKSSYDEKPSQKNNNQNSDIANYAAVEVKEKPSFEEMMDNDLKNSRDIGSANTKSSGLDYRQANLDVINDRYKHRVGSDGKMSPQKQIEQARKAAGETQGNILDGSIGKMDAYGMNAQEAIRDTLKNAGYSDAHADIISSEMAETGVMSQYKQKMADEVSSLGKEMYVQNPDMYDGMAGAYRSAAGAIFESKGIETAGANKFGDSVCLRDNYETIMKSANDIQQAHNNVDNKISKSDAIDLAKQESIFGFSSIPVDELDKTIYKPTNSRGSSKVFRAYNRNNETIRSNYSLRKDFSYDKHIDKYADSHTHYGLNRSGQVSQINHKKSNKNRTQK